MSSAKKTPFDITADDVAASAPAVDEELWERRNRALTMRNGGATWQQIAERLDVSTTTARKDVRVALREVISEPAEDMLARQRSVLFDLQRSNYVRALNGDNAAAKIVLSCMEHEAKLFGLYAPARVAIGVTDVEFAERAVDLISSMNLQPPAELLKAREPENSNVLDAVQIIDAEVEADDNDSSDDDDDWADI